MRSIDGWIFVRPLKGLLLVITVLFLFITIHTCSASESQNKTLTEVSSYNFTSGFYNLVQYAENEKSNLYTVSETEIPYLNITYQAPSAGYLDIYLKPIVGPVPYIELDKYWEIKSLTYSKTLEEDEITYFFLSPPMTFSSSNFSQVVGGGITVWELYNWPNLSGLINYTFTTADETTFDLIYYPVYPKQGEEISLFTESNVEIHNITWKIVGEIIDWENNSDVLEIGSLDEGAYLVYVTGLDEFNISHSAQAQIVVESPLFEATFFDLSLFSVDYPESVNVGDSIPISAIVDYSLSYPTEVKIIFEDQQNGDEYAAINHILSGNGSIKFESNFEAIESESGIMNISLRMFYNTSSKWVELVDVARSVSIAVNDVEGPQVLPSFSFVSLSIGLILVLVVNLFKSRK